MLTYETFAERLNEIKNKYCFKPLTPALYLRMAAEAYTLMADAADAGLDPNLIGRLTKAVLGTGAVVPS